LYKVFRVQKVVEQDDMRVLINAIKLDEGDKHSLSGNFYHVYYFVMALARIKDITIKVLVDEITLPFFSQILNDESLVFVPLRTSATMMKVVKSDYAVYKFVKQLKPDIYHRPTGQLPLFPIDCKAVSTIADLNFTVLKMPVVKRIYKNLSYWWTVRRADLIICVSRYTREQLVTRFGVDPGKVFVVHHGTNVLPPPSFKLSNDLVDDYWLTFGHQSHKNVETCLFALKKFNEGGPHTHLVVVGEHRYIDEILKPLAQRLGLDDSVHFVGYVGREELHGLYRKALGMLFLSKYEGFGMPLLEAMVAGCPVICSNIPVLEEVGGDAVLTARCDDVETVVQHMRSIHTDKKFRSELIRKGLSRSTLFDWDDSARRTITLYEKIVGAGGKHTTRVYLFSLRT
jgi:glycosyltransferase involved in cell wall biosynthesis